ncbi:MAG TPA: potassium transporter Kup [Acetobacteraceae bacterium]|nr:potassium transporter Kup [Acetobacteraceae bacterium]
MTVLAAAAPATKPARPGLAFGALIGVLGVVYGDIGTSPLYAVQSVLALFPDQHATIGEILGCLSLIFWSLFLIVTVKYVLLVMRADNRGEGGILALMALAQRTAVNPRVRATIALLGIGGACLLFGDGVITPAISVLSAIEGIAVPLPQAETIVLPLAAVIIVALFAVQSRGTGTVGKLFGPVMVVWFTSIGALGAIQIAHNPGVIAAVLPQYAVIFCVHHGGFAFAVLGAVVLAVTGAEALYADMGHFGARPIRLAWLFFVLPALLLNYFGQGALIIADPKAAANPFYLAVPPPLRLPMVVLATAATVIASQALISGAFSISRQCMQLGFLPRMTVRHTSQMEEGQIFVPQVNTALMIGVLILVFSFKSSAALGSAYGIAVTGTFICTCILATAVFRRQFGWPRWAAILVWGGFLLIDGTFFAANSLKVVEGGWVPLALGGCLMIMMTTWKQGRDLMTQRWRQDSLPLASFLARLPQSRTLRVPGMAVFLTGQPDYVPSALLHNLKHNKVLHEKVLFVTVTTLDEPEAGPARRTEVQQLAPGIHRVKLQYGFMESPNVPKALAELKGSGVEYDPMQASYFLGRETVVRAMAPKLSLWRLWLFLLMARNAVSATEFFRIPSDRVVELGVRIAI